MLAGTFQSKLRRLNSNLRIYCGDNSARPAGIFHVVRGEYTELCGVDKNEVPEHSIFDANGAHIKGGWRRALKILIKMGLVDRRSAQKVFRTNLNYKSPKRYKLNRDTTLGCKKLV